MVEPARHHVARRLSDLHAEWPHDATVRNLAGLLDQALETSARLRMLAMEAEAEGLRDCVATYDRLNEIEREQILALEIELARQLGASLEASGRDARRAS